jgi:probable rRNA maturation factor
MLVEVSNQTAVDLDPAPLKLAAESVLKGEGLVDAVVSIAIVDDRHMRLLNRRHLQHDYPTDVLSFLLERDGDRLEGEVVVSVDTAAAQARQYNSSTADELLLYVVHGALHLAGYDDRAPSARRTMRRKERKYLGELGVAPRWKPS